VVVKGMRGVKRWRWGGSEQAALQSRFKMELKWKVIVEGKSKMQGGAVM
jgi:hypothetical protein